MTRLTIAAATHSGSVREHNEDAYLKGERILAVADGMGGARGGEVASSTALGPIAALDGQDFRDAAAVQSALREAFIAANAAVSHKAFAEPALRGMGTTLTAAVVHGPCLYLAHVGDSRAYLIRNGQLHQLTRDHTVVAELIAAGELTIDEAAIHPLRASITRAIGAQADTEVDLLTVELFDRDRVLLCSDGLTRPVSEDDILSVLRSEWNVHEAAQKLVELANERGSPDNVTVLLLGYEDARMQGEGYDTPIDFAQTVEQPCDRGPDGKISDDSAARSRWRWITTVALASLVGCTIATGYWWLSRSVYVGLKGNSVAIYHGVPAMLGPIELSWIAERSDVHVNQLADSFVARLRDGVRTHNLVNARRIIANAPLRSGLQQSTRPSASSISADRAADSNSGGHNVLSAERQHLSRE